LCELGLAGQNGPRVAGTVSGYQRYLRRSRAEFGCPKPIHRELRTGWFSDRSACYLASGRPVLIEDTGLSDHLPTGEGLLVFRDLAEAVAGVEEIATTLAISGPRAGLDRKRAEHGTTYPVLVVT